MICFELCRWRKLCGDQCISEEVVLRSPSSQTAEMLLSYRRDILQDQCINLHMFISADPTGKQTKFQKTTTIICHSTAKHRFIEDLFAASHHSCSPEWPLGRPLLKGCEPSCSFILLGHVWQDRSKDSSFCL